MKKSVTHHAPRFEDLSQVGDKELVAKLNTLAEQIPKRGAPLYENTLRGRVQNLLKAKGILGPKEIQPEQIQALALICATAETAKKNPIAEHDSYFFEKACGIRAEVTELLSHYDNEEEANNQIHAFSKHHTPPKK